MSVLFTVFLLIILLFLNISFTFYAVRTMGTIS